MNKIKLENIYKSYKIADEITTILNDASIEITQKKPTVFWGPSGSGKSTLLQIIGGLLKPDAGKIDILDVNIYPSGNNNNINKILQDISWVLPDNQLINELTVIENLTIFAEARKVSEIETKVQQISENFNINHLLQYHPQKLSSGEKQRLSIARALLCEPAILIMDEPSSSIDAVNKESILETLFTYFEKLNMIIVIATHDEIFQIYDVNHYIINDNHQLEQVVFNI
jgi:ABC-type lipoprotein export system ATPase subunit